MYDRYKMHFIKRTILRGINDNIQLLWELDIEHLFVMLEWLPLVKLIKPVSPTLVRAFYANVEVLPTCALFANLEAGKICVDAKRIWKIARAPSVGLKLRT